MKLQINECFIPYIHKTDRHLLLVGGAGSGKSHFAAQKCVIRCLKDKTKHRILCVRKVRATIRNSVFSLIRDMLIDLTIVGMVKINRAEMSFTFPNGNEIITAGLDDPEKIKSIANITSIWGEEVTEFTQEDFLQTDLRMRGQNDTYFQYIMTFNPIDSAHWIREYFFLD